MTAPLAQLWTVEELTRLDAIIAVRDLVAEDAALFPRRTTKAISTQAAKRRQALNIPQGAQGRHRIKRPKPTPPDSLLRRQLETRQIPNWNSMLAHWQKHGAPVCAGLLG